MKPTKEQLADPKWWEFYVGDKNYCYWQEKTNSLHATSLKMIDSAACHKGLELLAKRPEPEVLETDWLKEGVNVTTPKGIAEVHRVTEDDGVYTSLGNFCRSELSEVKPEWVPEVGVDCEVKIGRTWMKCKVDYICEQYIVVLTKDSNGYGALVRGHYEFRPIKTQREELINIILLANNMSKGSALATANLILHKFTLANKDDK